MNIKEALEYGVNKIKKNQIDEPILKAKIILAKVLNTNKEYLIINETEEINEQKISIYKDYINQICNNVPLQYITKTKEFMGLSFFVDERVLIPQPDTEILVEETLNIINNNKCKKVLDLCTGSGAIAISLKKFAKNVKVVGSDISMDAIDVAKINAKKNETDVEFIYSDLFDRINEKFDVMVSNPPYIKTGIIRQLDKEVQNEPKLALDGGQDGLDFYRKIINSAYKFLEKEGYLCLEIGFDQKEDVINLINKNGNYEEIYSKKDLAGNDRVIICKVK